MSSEISNTRPEPPVVSVDLVAFLRRHNGLVSCSVLACIVLGIIYCLVAERKYESRADILIEQKHAPTFNEQTNKDRLSHSLENELETHRLVIQSPVIIEQATERDGLAGLPELADVQPNKIADHWDSHLSVNVPDDKASVVSIRYRGSSPDDCKQIVDSIVSSYRIHLAENSAALGSEIGDLILNGKDDLLSQLKSIEQDYADFQKSAPLLWKEGDGSLAGEQIAVNMFRERQTEIENKRKELLVEKSLLEAKIHGIADALSKGGQAEAAVYYEALIELHNADDEDTLAREASRGYGYELNREYMRLLVQEREMSVEFGDGHPDLIAIRLRLDELRGAVETSLGRSLDDGLAVDSAKNGDTKNPQYVEIYLRMLLQKKVAFELQLESLDRDFVVATKEAEKIQQYVAKDKEMRATRERTERLFDAVVARLEEINIIQDYGGESMQIIASAMQGEKVWPSIPLVMVLSLMLGSVSGVGAAIVREFNLRVFVGPEEIKQTLNAPVLGQVPLCTNQQKNPAISTVSPSIGVVHNGTSRFAETFRGIRTALHFSSEKNKQVMLVTSPTPGDGKSTTTANLASTIATSNRKVLLIDADMRKPQLHLLFGEKRESGLSEALHERAPISSVVKPTGVPNLDLITAGSRTENPAELLTYDSLNDALSILRSQYDFILIDSPPLLAVSDPAILAPRADGVILVVRIKEKVRSATERARDILNSVDANLIGAVVNGVTDGFNSMGAGNYYSSGYSYGYGYSGSDEYYREEEPQAATAVMKAKATLSNSNSEKVGSM